jgi:hypothetical protein
MATLSVDKDQLVVEFARWERPFTLRRCVRIPLTAVREIRSQERPLAATRSARLAGIEIFGVLKVGLWQLAAGTRLLTSVRRGTTAVHITVAPGFDGSFDEILVSAPETAVAAALARKA